MDDVVVTAGCILLRFHKTSLQVAMYRDPEKGEYAWMLPKGHVHADETILACAIRETREEVGATEFAVLTRLGSVRRRSVEYWGEVVDKEIIYFLAIDLGSDLLAPSLSEPATEAAWIPLEDAAEVIPFPEEARFLQERLLGQGIR